MSESGAAGGSRPAASDAARREDRHQRLAGPERGDRLLDVVVGRSSGTSGRSCAARRRRRRERPRACWTRLPSWARTDDGTSVGACVTKYTPTPFDRMSRAVRSIWSISASDASSKSRCASSKKKTSFGFGRSPASGRLLVELGQHPQHERREQPRLVHDVGQLEDADDALAVRRRPQQVDDLELRLAEEASTPSCSRTMIERSSTPTEALDIPPYSSRIGLPSSDERNLSVVARSSRSSSGRSWSSQYLKIRPGSRSASR